MVSSTVPSLPSPQRSRRCPRIPAATSPGWPPTTRTVLLVFQVLTKSVVSACAGPATPTTASSTTPAPTSHPRRPAPALKHDATDVFENMTHPHPREVPGIRPPGADPPRVGYTITRTPERSVPRPARLHPFRFTGHLRNVHRLTVCVTRGRGVRCATRYPGESAWAPRSERSRLPQCTAAWLASSSSPTRGLRPVARCVTRGWGALCVWVRPPIQEMVR